MIGGPPRAFAVVARLVLAVVYALPLLWIILTSFKSNSQILSAPNSIIFTPTLQTLRSVISAGSGAILTSLRIVATVTVAVLLVSVPASYALARRISPAWARTIAIVLGGLLVLQMVPQPMTVIPLYGVLGRWHLIGHLTGLVLADVALLAPFSILLMRPFVLAIPQALYEAAELDGAGSWQSFRYVALPMLTNGIATVASIVFIAAWGEFIYAINFLSVGSTLPVSGLLANQISTYSVSWNRLMSLAFLTSLPLVVLFAVSQKRLVRGLSVGAVK